MISATEVRPKNLWVGGFRTDDLPAHVRLALCLFVRGKMVSRMLTNLATDFQWLRHKSLLFLSKLMVPQEGFEPPTPSLRMMAAQRLFERVDQLKRAACAIVSFTVRSHLRCCRIDYPKRTRHG